MSDEELLRRIEECRTDYTVQFGDQFSFFYCPILRSDEPVELCRGHVIPESLRSCNVWVPQRKDIDNFYGTFAEPEFIAVVRDHGKNAFELWLDPESRRKHRPRLEFEGRRLNHYFTTSSKAVPGQTPVTMVSRDGVALAKFVIKASSDEVAALDGKKIELVVERDYRAAVIASVLKAAHLSLFKMLGYRHVVSPAGIFLADILATFFREHRGKKKRDLEGSLEEYFRPFERMISPLVIQDYSLIQGTVVDNRVLACIGATEGMFSLNVIVKAADHEFCVFLPAEDGRTIETYTGFLNEPPPSTAVKLLQFFPAQDGERAHWGTNAEEPFRIPFHDSPVDLRERE